jgi:hypothetical protein
MTELIRRTLRFFLLEKVKATLWTSAVVLAVCLLNRLIYPTLQSSLNDAKPYSVITEVLNPLGMLSFVTTVTSFLFYRKRKQMTKVDS